jgi:hypothetical protein
MSLTPFVLLLVMTGLFTAQYSQRAGAAGGRLRRLGFALSLAGLALAVWIVVQTVRDHGRDEPAASTTVQP